MKEIKHIVSEYAKVDHANRQVALATVVRVKGSSYRSPGARMLITDDGRWVGSISGGCLEGDALRKARQVMRDKKPLTVTYDTHEESNQKLGIGLGCNGVIDVFIEPVLQRSNENPIQAFQRILAIQEIVALATVFNCSSAEMIGGKIMIDQSGNILSNSLGLYEMASAIVHDLKKVFETNRSEVKTYSDACEVFIELIQPTISLIVFGGGFDARPVSQIAKSLGWNVTVTDECVSHIAPVFFPTADTLSLCQREFIDRDFNITPYTACVLMSHNYEYDRDVLKKLLKTETPYIGLLGPRKRFEKMQEEFLSNGTVVAEKDFHRIHSPIGLDIGAETPDEIAVSIIAEIQSKFSNRSGGFMKYNPGPIHPRDGQTNQVFKQIYLTGNRIKSINQ
ncbi:MAG: XdhC family protein [Cyclobacteriaceae bacterium]